jgi:hypothetical protein
MVWRDSSVVRVGPTSKADGSCLPTSAGACDFSKYLNDRSGESMSSIRTVFSYIATAALLTLPRPSNAADTDARVLTGDAGATIRHNPQMPWRPAPGNGRLAEVVQVRCEKRCAIQADQDHTIELEPGAIVAFRDHFFIPFVPVSPMTRARQLELVEGRIGITSSTKPAAKPIVVRHENSYFAVLA